MPPFHITPLDCINIRHRLCIPAARSGQLSRPAPLYVYLAMLACTIPRLTGQSASLRTSPHHTGQQHHRAPAHLLPASTNSHTPRQPTPHPNKPAAPALKLQHVHDVGLAGDKRQTATSPGWLSDKVRRQPGDALRQLGDSDLRLANGPGPR